MPNLGKPLDERDHFFLNLLKVIRKCAKQHKRWKRISAKRWKELNEDLMSEAKVAVYANYEAISQTADPQQAAYEIVEKVMENYLYSTKPYREWSRGDITQGYKIISLQGIEPMGQDQWGLTELRLRLDGIFDSEEKEIARMREAGMTFREIGNKLGLSESQVRRRRDQMWSKYCSSRGISEKSRKNPLSRAA